MPEQFLHGVEVVQIDDGIRPIRTAKSSVIGLVGTAPAAAGLPLNEPVLISGPRAAAALGATGTLRDAYNAIYAQGVQEVVMVAVAEGATPAETKANVVGDASLGTGVWALEAARARLDLTPRINIAPGFTSGLPGEGVNPVVSALISVSEKLRAVVVKDGPNTSEDDAKADRQNYGSDRLFIVDPAVTVFDTASATDVTMPASAHVAGLIARRDVEKGFWWSPSNQIIRGITGTTRPVGFHLSSAATEANRMNEAEVATIIRRDGFRLWGNRSTSADAQWAFLSVRRTADLLAESVEAAHLWAMDRPMSAQLFMDIRDGVQAFGQGLVRQGALLGFRCWLDAELNTEATLKAGKLYLDYAFEPPAPLEHLVFRAHREGTYYEDLVSSVKAAA
ncbi:phage tail sheath subtilisin-like domain-containing protein [Palleronia caenipelagi]|uniref:Phage tail protein n=1 Tax=Palleronia caenipelagi TaxID=2489174 RepID=A0A547PW71_9RHOB|nr:phage tail sheath subtilisin-like domain-containing protein [Palleronia caenipelagi]TRD18399.1 phage tail protein [Palleronia caenipelagi]